LKALSSLLLVLVAVSSLTGFHIGGMSAQISHLTISARSTTLRAGYNDTVISARAPLRDKEACEVEVRCEVSEISGVVWFVFAGVTDDQIEVSDLHLCLNSLQPLFIFTVRNHPHPQYTCIVIVIHLWK